MDVRQARAFLAVAEELHFGRAARRLHLAQPPLSRLIGGLEKQLGAKLFDRDSRNVKLTAVGQTLIEPARDLIMMSDRMLKLVEQVHAGTHSRLRIGFAGASVGPIVSGLIEVHLANHPNSVLSLSGSHLSHPGMDLVLEGTIDAIIGRWDYFPARVGALAIASEDILVALPSSHRLADAPLIEPSALDNESWVILPGGGAATLPTRLYEIAQMGRFTPRVVETAPDSMTQLLMVQTGVGIGLTFSGVREHLPFHNIVFRPIAGLKKALVQIAWRSNATTPGLKDLVASAEQLKHRFDT